MNLKKKSFKNIVTSIFSFSHNVFLPPQKEFLFLSYICFVVCKCFQFVQVQILLCGKELKDKYRNCQLKNIWILAHKLLYS